MFQQWSFPCWIVHSGLVWLVFKVKYSVFQFQLILTFKIIEWLQLILKYDDPTMSGRRWRFSSQIIDPQTNVVSSGSINVGRIIFLMSFFTEPSQPEVSPREADLVLVWGLGLVRTLCESFCSSSGELKFNLIDLMNRFTPTDWWERTGSIVWLKWIWTALKRAPSASPALCEPAL